MTTQEWMCQGCGNMNGHGMTAIPSSCMRCGLSHTARAYPAYDPRTGKVVDAPSLAARSPAPTCDCGAPRATSCVGCLQAEYQAAHPDCASCCPPAAPILEEREAEAAFDRELAELEANAPPVEAQLPDDYDLNLVVEPAGYYIEPLASTPGAPPDQHPEVDAHSLKAPTDRQEQR